MNSDKKLTFLKKYFKSKGFYCGDGLKYGADILLYADHPNKIHSKYALLIENNQTYLQIMAVQRVCNSSKKVLLLVKFFEESQFKIVQIERFIGRNENSNQI